MKPEDKIPTAVELQGRVVELELRASNLRRALEGRVVRRTAQGNHCQICKGYSTNWGAMPGSEHRDSCPLWVPVDERSFTGF